MLVVYCKRKKVGVISKGKKKNEFILKLAAHDRICVAVISRHFKKKMAFVCRFADDTNIAAMSEKQYYTLLAK